MVAKHCDLCPCLNKGEESGNICNLQYMVNTFRTWDDRLVSASLDCGLSSVSYSRIISQHKDITRFKYLTYTPCEISVRPLEDI